MSGAWLSLTRRYAGSSVLRSVGTALADILARQHNNSEARQAFERLIDIMLTDQVGCGRMITS